MKHQGTTSKTAIVVINIMGIVLPSMVILSDLANLEDPPKVFIGLILTGLYLPIMVAHLVTMQWKLFSTRTITILSAGYIASFLASIIFLDAFGYGFSLIYGLLEFLSWALLVLTIYLIRYFMRTHETNDE